MTEYLGVIFDLDGVLVDTAKYHFLAWKKLADQLDIPFTEEDNERLKGVSRIKSLDILLSLGNKSYSEDAYAGIEAAKKAGMLAIGVGNRKSLPHADVLVETLENLDLSVLKSKKDGDIK